MTAPTGPLLAPAWVAMESVCCHLIPTVPVRRRRCCMLAGGQSAARLAIWNGCLPPQSADMNCDGIVDASDAAAFVLALIDPIAYQNSYPSCNIGNGDLDFNGGVDADDIAGYVLWLIRS